MTHDDPHQIAQAIVDRIDDAWEHEGWVPPDVLTKDAFYTNVGGRSLRGRAEIAEGTRKVKERFQTGAPPVRCPPLRAAARAGVRSRLDIRASEPRRRALYSWPDG